MCQKGTKIYSIVAMKCPQCHETNMFRTPLLPKFKLYDMHETCEVCGLKYEMEPGFWWGSMYVGYAFSSGALLITALLCLTVFQLELSTTYMILLAMIPIGVPLNARLARSTYINFWVSYDPKYKKAKEEAAK